MCAHLIDSPGNNCAAGVKYMYLFSPYIFHWYYYYKCSQCTVAKLMQVRLSDKLGKALGDFDLLIIKIAEMQYVCA